ncbi:MAG: hypothetical protein C5B52_13275 [Bacteroidetes bacterium]|nr:MAG: hypothetical protein C5B52_13275 [Bacteroidota bacterium]
MPASTPYNNFKLSKWVRRNIVLKRFNSPAGWIILCFFAALFAFCAVYKIYTVNFAIIGAFGGAIVLGICLMQPLLGFYITIFASFFVFLPTRMGINVPLSTGVEILVLVTFIGVYFSRSKIELDNYASFLKSPVSIALIIYTLFFIVEAFNPNMYSLEGWVFFIRRWAGFLMVYLIAYRVLNTWEKIYQFISFWIIMAFITALYGCKQAWFGLFPFEMNWLKSDPHEYSLIFTAGYLRKFSLLSDPPAFGILSGSMSMLCLILGLSEPKKKRKRFLFFAALIMYLGMSYSGTRTTNIIPPAAVALYALMTITHKRTLMLVFFSIMGFMFIFFAPIDNPTINRMRTTFKSDDQSLNVRDVNRHLIQPYIYAHPLGGGIETSAQDGLRFNPGHPLAGFPHDSGLLKSAIETGWVGYAFMLGFFFIVLFQGIHFYYLMTDPLFKHYIIAITVVEFSYVVTQYSQTSIGQIPSTFLFYPILAIMTRLLQLDRAKRKSQETKILSEI